jgi:hypothetical protein
MDARDMEKCAPVAAGETSTVPLVAVLPDPVNLCAAHVETRPAPAQQRRIDAALRRDDSVVRRIDAPREARQVC